MRWFNSLLNLLKNIFIAKKERVCKWCGYRFDSKKHVGICSKCIEKFYRCTPSKKDRLIRKFNREPNICPICKEKLSFDKINNSKLYCPNCHKMTE